MTATIALDDFRDRVRYGAIDLKKAYNKNLGMALGISVGIHLILIALYVFGGVLGKSGSNGPVAIDKTKLVSIAPPPQAADAPPPPPPPMIPPEMNNPGKGGGVASRAGNPIPVPDAVIAPDVKEFASTNEISVATPQGGDGTGLGTTDPGVGLGDATLNSKAQEQEHDPDPDEFVANATQPDVDLGALAKNITYPEIARKNNIEGTVNVSVLVDETGKPIKTRINSSDNKLFEKPAIDAIMRTHFTPGIQNGHPIKLWVAIPVNFKITQ